MKTELWDVVMDVDKLSGGVDCPLSPGHLPGGTTAVQTAAKKDPPAGMSWIAHEPPGLSRGGVVVVGERG
jgi:hypothetical protein